MAGQIIQVSVLADTKKFSRAMKKLGDETGFSKLAAGAKKVGKAMAVAGAAAGAAVVVLGKQAVDAASNLQQSMGGVDAVFKDSAAQVHQWAKSAASDMGLSKNAYNEAATIIGTTLKNAGIPMDQLGGKTNNLIGLSADLAATFGGSVADASAAMGSALRGEFEPLRRFGISLNQADIAARALADTGKANVDQLTKEEKALATQALMYEQSADAQGAFARESNTLAGQQERLKARFENVKATLGTYLLPIMTRLTALVGDRLEPAMASFTEWIKSDALPRLRELSDAFQTRVLPTLQTFATWLQTRVLPVLQDLARFIVGTVVPGLVALGSWVVSNRKWLAALAAPILAIIVAWKVYQRTLLIVKAAQAAYNAALVIGRAVQQAYAFGTYGQIAGNKTLATTLAALTGALRAKIAAMAQGLAAGARSLVSTVAQTASLVAHRVALVATAVATRTAAVAQWAMNAAMSANPIGLIIAAIAALVAGLVWFFTQTETGKKLWAGFTAALSKGWEAIKSAFSKGYAAVKDWLGKAWAFIKTVWSYSPLGLVVTNWNKITGAFSAGYAKVKGWLQNAKDFIVRIWSYNPVSLVTRNWDKIVSYVKSLPGKLASGLGSLYAKLTSPFRRAFNAIAGFWNRTVGRVSFSVPDWVPGMGGRGWSLPRIPMLAAGGIATGPTLAMIGEGRESEAILPLSKLQALLDLDGNGSRVHNYEIHVHTGVGDPVAIGREVSRVVSAYERANGGRRFA